MSVMQKFKRGIHSVRGKNDLKKYLLIVPNIISECEEEAIIRFVQPKLQRKRYEGDHWDSVISKYKETEMSLINVPDIVSQSIERISGVIRESTAAHDMIMMPPHVLDLSAEGFIGPHVDSIKFSGGIVAGLSLLSTRLMRLAPDHKDQNYADSASCVGSDRIPYYSLDCKGNTSNPSGEPMRSPFRGEQGQSPSGEVLESLRGQGQGLGHGQSPPGEEQPLWRHDPFLDTNDLYNGSIEMILPPRSLYILSGPLRYSFTHEIFGPDKGPLLFPERFLSERRLSVIFRDELPALKT